MFGGCDLAISGGMPSNMLVNSGVSWRVCMGCSICWRGVRSKSGPSVAENVGLGLVGWVWCFMSKSSRLKSSLNSGFRKSSG